MSAQTFRATGLTCGHCAGAVVSELSELAGVSAVDVDVVKDGESTITVESSRALADTEVAAALDEAGGYALVGA